MSIWLKIANRSVLENSQHPIDAEERRRVAVASSDGEMEAWVIEGRSDGQAQPDLFGLKFPGTGGRAEKGGPHPCEWLARGRYEVWTINPPGYGGSAGNACVSKMVETCERSWQAIQERASDRPIVVIGNSLGGLYALYIAARFPVAGLFLRNCPPLPQLIRGRYGWWNLGWAAKKVAQQIPEEMDGIQNARRCSAPAFFVMSEADRLVPQKYQQQIIDAYAGPKSVFVIENADHHHPVGDSQVESYSEAVRSYAEQVRTLSK